MNMFNPEQTVQTYAAVGDGKCRNRASRLFVLAILAGIFIATGAAASSTAAHGIADVGVARLVSGALFPVGLIMVVLMGAELFTGNCLIVISVLSRKASVAGMVRCLAIVYVGNFVGSLIAAVLVAFAGQLNYSGNYLAAYAIKIAVGKCSLNFVPALLSGIMCNILVCMAVIGSVTAKDTAGKILASYFPILTFIVCGFEHCVANMYYIGVALFAKLIPAYADAAAAAGVDLANLSIGRMLYVNLLPVTIGNVIGGLLVGAMLWYGHTRKADKTDG